MTLNEIILMRMLEVEWPASLFSLAGVPRVPPDEKEIKSTRPKESVESGRAVSFV